MMPCAENGTAVAGTPAHSPGIAPADGVEGGPPQAGIPPGTEPDLSLFGLLNSDFRQSLMERWRAEPRQLRAIRSVELLLAAGERIFRRAGLAGLSLEAVAEEAAISPQAAYRYFASVGDLVLAVIRRNQVRNYRRLIWTIQQMPLSSTQTLVSFTLDQFIANFKRDYGGLPPDWMVVYRNQHEIYYDGITRLAAASQAALVRNGLAGPDLEPVQVSIGLVGMISALKLLRRQDPALVDHPAYRQAIIRSYVATLRTA